MDSKENLEQGTPPEDAIPSEEAAPAGTLPDDKKEAQNLANLEKRIADTEAALKERQREFFEFAKTAGATEAQIRQLIEARQQKEEPDPLDNPETDEKLSTDPLYVKRVIRERESRLKREIADLLRERDGYWDGRVQKLKDMMMESSPALSAQRKAHDELSKKPWFGMLDDDARQQAVKDFVANRQSPDTLPPVSGRRTPAERKTEVNEDAEALIRALGLDGEAKDPRIVI